MKSTYTYEILGDKKIGWTFYLVGDSVHDGRICNDKPAKTKKECIELLENCCQRYKIDFELVKEKHRCNL